MKPPEKRRKHQRVPVSIPVGIYTKAGKREPVDAEITDISEGGAFIHCTAPFPIGKEVILEIRFAETKVLEGKVVEHSEEMKVLIPGSQPESSVVKWARGSSRAGFGIEFTGLQEDKKMFLERLVQYFERLKLAGVSFDSE